MKKKPLNTESRFTKWLDILLQQTEKDVRSEKVEDVKPRKLKLESGIWRYLVGDVATTLWKPSGKKLRVLNWYIGGATAEGHYCFDEHCTAAGLPVTPGKLRKYIEENLEG